MIFVNFKTYPDASGQKAIELARAVCDVSSQTGIEIISCPQTIDLKGVVAISDHKVWVQHVDLSERGRATGWLPPEIAKEAGAEGTLLNHSEHKLSFQDLSKTVTRCKNVGLKVLIFADSVNEATSVSSLKPDYIGYEPPELIASKDTSVSQAKPEVIKAVVDAVPDTPILIGAGVKNSEDVQVGKKLGAVGVALSSSVVLAENPKSVLEELTVGFK